MSKRFPLLPDQFTPGYPPKAGETAPTVQYFALADILTRGWTTDAHTTAYSVEAWPYRLSKAAIQLDGGVLMVVFIADVDCEQSHTASGGHGDVPAPDEWWLQELDKIEQLQHAHPGAFIYRTRGGYRLVYLLPEPRPLHSPADVDAWKADYRAWVAALRLRFRIYADPACQDWQRLYRVPHATRTRGGRPEARDTLGSPYHIGIWTCEPTVEERELAKTLAKRPSSRPPRAHVNSSVNAGDGVFFYAFQARGWIDQAVEPGKWPVRCPWDDQHTKGKPFDGSTVLYAPGAGHTLGWLHCSHAHCQHRDSRDVLGCFSREELSQAERAAGLAPFTPQGTNGHASSTSDRDHSLNGDGQDQPSNPEDFTPPGGTMADKPRIRLTTELTDMVDDLQRAILALPGPRLFQRARQLCILGRGIKPPKWLRRPADAPVILPILPAALRELATEAATFQRYDKRAKTWDEVLPPMWIIETLAARPSWPFPLLEGVVCTPTLRPDGSILLTPGYDEDTGLFLEINGTAYPPLRKYPTLDDARTAIGLLREPFFDFPFAATCHFSTALAAILSLVARYAIQGHVPLFAVRSNIRGAGKGLLIDVISGIATGRPAPRWAQTEDQEEERKRLLTIALAGDVALHIDNVTAPLGSAALDMALTAPTFSDRILGQQVSREAPMHAVFFASGNNMQFQGDLARRVVPIDLDSPMEHPEERGNFLHSPLMPWVLKERPTLVMAALTILKAYFEAGCPAQGIKPMGSFEEWSGLIRQALIWAGEADPCTGRQDIEAESDPQYEALNSLMTAWYEQYRTDLKTVKQVKEDLDAHTVRDEGRWIIHPEWRDLHSALVSLDKRSEVNERAIGYALRGWKGRMIGNKRFTMIFDRHTKVNQWRVEVE